MLHRLHRSRLVPLAFVLAATSLVGGCGLLGDDGPLKVVVIGTNLKMTNPDLGRPTPVAQSLLTATAQGLLSFDGDGQIEPGLAERWVVTDDGLSYIFRIRDAEWANGDPVTTAHVVSLLRAHVRPASKNRYAPEISGVESIRAMTAQVIEIRLTRPLPQLLDILAQPDMALLRNGRGWGPMTATSKGDGLLLAVPKEVTSEEQQQSAVDDIHPVELWARSASKALARYRNKEADVILGGRFVDYPLLSASGIDNNRIIVDPAEGMFGLVITHDDGILGNVEVRRAISMAIRRDALTQAMGEPSWTPLATLRPPLDKQDPAYAPVVPAFAALDEATRIANARAIISAATEGLDHKPVLRIALPDGPGADLLFAMLRADLRVVGLDAVQVKLASAADLRLIDEVAPSRDPFWYVRSLSCARGNICNSIADAKLREATNAPDAASKATLFREAESLVVDTAGYIPLAEPLRWSVTSPRSNELKPNPRARHPLNRLTTVPS